MKLRSSGRDRHAWLRTERQGEMMRISQLIQPTLPIFKCSIPCWGNGCLRYTSVWCHTRSRILQFLWGTWSHMSDKTCSWFHHCPRCGSRPRHPWEIEHNPRWEKLPIALIFEHLMSSTGITYAAILAECISRVIPVNKSTIKTLDTTSFQNAFSHLK